MTLQIQIREQNNDFHVVVVNKKLNSSVRLTGDLPLDVAKKQADFYADAFFECENVGVVIDPEISAALTKLFNFIKSLPSKRGLPTIATAMEYIRDHTEDQLAIIMRVPEEHVQQYLEEFSELVSHFGEDKRLISV